MHKDYFFFILYIDNAFLYVYNIRLYLMMESVAL